MTASLTLFDFTQPNTTAQWRATNDGVMGGLSQSSLKQSSEQSALFTGYVSLENNGGFASVRSTSHHYNLSPYNGLRLHIRGDGKHYKLRIKTKSVDDIFYEAGFSTQKNEWQQIDISFKTLTPKYRGKTLADAPAFNAAEVESFGLMISEKQEGEFCLEVKTILAIISGI
jgi:hypothetical protein